MADLDLQEMKMFSKWYSTRKLVNNQEFWRDCMSAYVDKSISLPMYDEPAEEEAILKMVKCPPGQCGACCRYDKVSITWEEYELLRRNTQREVIVLSDNQGNIFLDSSDGCQFLKNNICTIHSFRPSTCRAFPIITPKDAVATDGAEVKQIQMRLKCQASLEVIRSIFSRACSNGKVMLLPDLSLIPLYEGGKGVLGCI